MYSVYVILMLSFVFQECIDNCRCCNRWYYSCVLYSSGHCLLYLPKEICCRSARSCRGSLHSHYNCCLWWVHSRMYV